MIPTACYMPETLADPCSFYVECLERASPCEASDGGRKGDAAYAVSYGFKYCSRFSALGGGEALSDAGRGWIATTRSCLQTALVPFLPEEPRAGATCGQIRAAAFDSHPFCYLEAQPSFCRLPLGDYGPILSLYELPDMVTAESVRQMVSVIDGCLKQIAEPGRLRRDRDAGGQARKNVLGAWKERLQKRGR